MKYSTADLKRFLSSMGSEQEHGIPTPQFHVTIQMPDMVAAMQRMFGTPDGESLRVRDSVSPRP